MSSNPITQKKRNRERAQKERKQEKDHKRALRKEEKLSRKTRNENDLDPDLAGIVPGPHNRPPQA